MSIYVCNFLYELFFNVLTYPTRSRMSGKINEDIIILIIIIAFTRVMYLLIKFEDISEKYSK